MHTLFSYKTVEQVDPNPRLMDSNFPRNSPLDQDIPDLTDSVVVDTDFNKKRDGGISDVFRGMFKSCKSEDFVEVAVKIFRSPNNDGQKMLEYLNTEANAWHKLRHPNILEFLGTINLPCNRVGLVAPFKEINNALSYIKRFSEFQRRNIILGIAKGLRYIHHEDVIHGDLRLKSILFDDDGTPRISDFGLSRLIDHTADTTNLQYGSWSYAAPEIIIKATQDDSNIPRTAKWTTKATDVYAFSITAAEIFMGKPYRLNELNAYKLVVDKNVRPLKSDVNSPRYFSLLEACWEKKPEKRLLIEQVEKRLEYVNHAGELQNGALNDGPVH